MITSAFGEVYKDSTPNRCFMTMRQGNGTESSRAKVKVNGKIRGKIDDKR